MLENSLFGARGSLAVALSVSLLGALGGGCSVISDFGHYTSRDGADGGFDGGGVDSGGFDGGGVDAGDRDGGGEDGGGDAGPPECEPACAAGETCEAGVCRCGAGNACSAAQGCCDGMCTALDSVDHCGSCGMSCGTRAGASATCTGSGTCAYSCNGGVDDCNGDIDDPAGDGCESNLSDTSTCQSCTVSCAAGEVCASTGCRSTCPAGDSMCGTSCYTAGSTCRCMPTSAPGGLACTGGVVACSYPTEVCNGADDDCDGRPDDTFACVRGTTSTCTVTSGTCSATGTSTCNATCGAGACIATETCNRVDGDCDGFVDESMLVTGTTGLTVTGEIVEPRAAYNPTRDELAIVYGVIAGPDFRLFVQRARPDGTPIGPTEMVTDRAVSWDIAWDGNHYTVAHIRTAGTTVTMRRVDASGGLGANYIFSSPSGAQDVRVARVGTTTELVVVSTHSGGQAFANGLFVPPGLTASFSMIGFNNLPAGGGTAAPTDPFAVRTQTGALVGVSTRDATMAQINAAFIMPGATLGGMIPIATTSASFEVGTEAAYDVATDHVALTYQEVDSGSGAARETRLTLIDLATFAVSADIDLGTGIGLRSVASGADSTFGLLTTGASGGANVTRYRASDLRVVPGAALSPSVPSPAFLVGIGGTGTHRYLALGTSSSSLMSQPISCSP